jgi:cytochrome c553
MKRVNRFLMVLALVASVGVWFACENEEGGETKGGSHNAGQNCLSCHKSGGEGEGVFKVGGTVYKTGTTTGLSAVSVKLYSTADGTGTAVASLTSDNNGNFYTKSTLNFGTGLYVKVTSANGTSSMMSPITTGACNSCHGVSTGIITVQ